MSPSLRRKILSALLRPSQVERVANRWRDLRSLAFPADLVRLAINYGSDKWGAHRYATRYQFHFSALRKKPVTLLEIGIGGYEDSASGGSSLRMWKRYFPKGRIYGIDIHDKSPHNGKRIRTLRGDQTDEAFLRQVICRIGAPDIIIDDGSHVNSHVLKSFEVLFPLLADGGIYVIEDVQTSYWPSFGGSSEKPDMPDTIMGSFKGLLHGLNHQEFERPGYTPTYFDRNIVAFHFYHNLIFIYKGVNNEGSNFIKDNRLLQVRGRR